MGYIHDNKFLFQTSLTIAPCTFQILGGFFAPVCIGIVCSDSGVPHKVDTAPAPGKDNLMRV
jgi:hypothetical protein